VTANAYLRWLRTQRYKPHRDIEYGPREEGWLFHQKALHSRRAPGTTCLSALRSIRSLGEPAKNDSKGCGGVMRVAPVGLFAHRVGQDSRELVFQLGADLAGLTHGHPTGQLPAGVFSVVVQLLAEGSTLPEALAQAKPCLRAARNHDETLAAIEQAERLAGSDLPPHEAIRRLGQGWVAEEALAISLYCALVAKDFRHGVILAVNHDGDSDSTGSITGNLLGTILGVDALPREWLEPLELRDVITEIANDLHDCPDWDIGAYGGDAELRDRIWTKYPGV
jgi:ADP-ribosylglycohydrolase